MGGFGAARLGFQYPELFGAVSTLAGALLDENSFQARHQGVFQNHFGGDASYFNELTPRTRAQKNADILKAKTKIRQVVGDRDPTLVSNREYDAHLTKLGIPHTFTILPGVGHAPGAIYAALGEDNWKFYAAVFADTETH